MKFLSTRGQTPPHSFTEAVATGLAPDGGLFVPETLPRLTPADLAALAPLPYPALTHALLSRFATDIPEGTLRALVEKSYTRFDHPDIAPIVRLDGTVSVLELFHGPTLAFKDFALQLLGNLYEYQCERHGGTLNVLGATSGDTGSAAIHGLLGKPRVNIFIAYPDGRTSALQERQMACTGAPNVHALAVEGTFDDAQRALKELFADQPFRVRHRLSAVNSINIARILAQCAYYLHAWLRLPEAERGATEFVVPTGNFGNVLAGWLLQKMGVPIRGFRVATNQNDILHRLFTTGDYRVGEVRPSLAPSMDIQVSSNFERYLYYTLGGDTARVREIMETFARTGRYRFEHFDPDTLRSSRCDDAEIPVLIRETYRRHGYIADPHTACAFKDLSKDGPSLILATAHPAKFPETIRDAIGLTPTHPSLEALKQRPLVRQRVPATAAAIRARIEAAA
ncbi:MAG: threonine synthase [Opitutaceae bacterium]|jgi:threonine synthase|nr:threonine synthase [Opitutaceae bacterium]